MAYRRRIRRRTAYTHTPAPAPKPTASLLPSRMPEGATPVDLEAYASMLTPEPVPDEHGVRTMHLTPDLLLALSAKHGEQFASEHPVPWSGCDRQTAFWLAVNGWQDGADLVNDLFAKVSATRTNTIMPILALSDEPDGAPDLEAALCGDDECYWVVKDSDVKVDAAGRFVTITVDPFVSWVVDVDTMCRRGMYAAALAIVLERAGYCTRVRIRYPDATEPERWSSPRMRRYLLTVDLKDFGEPLDIARVMFWLAHPAALRHHIFGAYRGWRDDAFYSREESERDRPLEPGEVKAPAVVGYQTSQSVEDWFKAALEQNGLTVEGF